MEPAVQMQYSGSFFELSPENYAVVPAFRKRLMYLLQKYVKRGKTTDIRVLSFILQTKSAQALCWLFIRLVI